MAKKNENTTPASSAETGLIKAKNAEDGLLYAGSLDELVRADDFEVRHFINLKEGQKLLGNYTGEGSGMDFTDPQTGEVRHAKTFIFQVRDNISVELLGSHQLEKRMKDVAIGKRVAIMHCGQVNTRTGRRVNDYLIAVGKDKPVIDVTP